MNGPASTTGDDLAYVRALAERGANAPLLGGRFMIWWGALITAAYVAHHLGVSGRLGQDGRIFAFIWPGFSLLGLIGHLLLSRGIGGKAGAGSAGNLASRSVWVAAAAAIGAQVAGSAVAAANGSGPDAFEWVVPVAFAVYACALVVTGSLAANRIVVAAGAGAVLMVGLFTALIQHPDRYLVAAAGVALTVFLPGILLLIAEPKD